MGLLKAVKRTAKRRAKVNREQTRRIIDTFKDDLLYTLTIPGKEPMRMTGKEWKELASV